MNTTSKTAKTLKRLSVLLVIAAMLSATMLTSSAYTVDEIVEATSEFIISEEGNYTTVAPNDAGALSIGLLGWHATRALNLLKSIINAAPEESQSILGDSLYNEINNYSNWESRTLNSDESVRISRVLGTDAGKATQDTLIKTDVTGYITRAISRGITNAQALIIYADVENQCGGSISYAVGTAAANTAGSFGAITLDIMYQAALNNRTAGAYSARRTRSYNFAKTHFTGGSSQVDTSTAPSSENQSSTSGAGTYTVTNTTSLNVRSGPGTNYDIVSTLSAGTTVNVTATSNGWAQFSGGWVSMNYLTRAAESTTAAPTTQPAPTTRPSANTEVFAVAVNSYLNVRSGPGTSYDVVGSLANGTQITVTNTQNGWAQFADGWVSMDYLTRVSESTTAAPTTQPAATTQPASNVYTVTVSSYLNVRSGPGTSYDVVGTLANGTRINVTNTQNGWAQFADGWVSMEYLTGGPESTTSGSRSTAAYPVYVVNDDALNVRLGPGTSYDIVGTLSRGTVVTVVETNGSWGRFEYATGSYGWISLNYATLRTAGRGDVNGDGSITAEDARLALRGSASLENLSATARSAADVNADGKVLADDARTILRVSARLESF